MQSGGRPGAIPHVAALDGARGAAVAGVLLFHGGHLRGGYLGVDFFFTLSGFLITSLLLAESERTGHVGLRAFWARRARRLLPALAVLMVGIVVYCLALATPDQLGQIRGDALATLAYVANWHEVFSHQNYFALFTAPSPLNHTWSLAIEEQFYLIWPLVFVAILARWKRDSPRAVLFTALVLAGLSSALMILLYSPANTARVYYGTDTRAAAILLGAALAAWTAMHGPTVRARRVLEGCGIVGVVVLAVAWTRLDGQSATLYRGGFLVCGLCATAVVAAAVHPQPGVISRALSFRPLCALGLISYGLYLYHWPIDIVLDQSRVGLSGWPLFVVQTACALLAAVISYRVIEQPIRRGALSSQQLRVLVPSAALGLVVLIVAGTAGARTQPTVSVIHHPLEAATQAFNSAPPNARRVLVVGNSIAYFLGQSMQTVPSSPPLAVLNTAITGCTFLPGATRYRAISSTGTERTYPAYTCDPSWEQGVVDRFHPDLVFWIMSGPPNGGLWIGNHFIAPCSAEYARRFRAGLQKETARLGSDGAHVVITTAAYPRYYAHGSDQPTTCENQSRRAVAASAHVQLADLFEFICPNGQCRKEQGGVVLRSDGEHYFGAGARIVAQWLIDQVDHPPAPQ